MKKNLLNKIKPYIFISNNVSNGEPLFKGTRIPVSFVLEQFTLGWNIKDIKNRHPELNYFHIKKVISIISNEVSNVKNDENQKENTWTYSYRRPSTSAI